MNVLIDCDVLLDLALDRHPYSAGAAALIEALQAGRGQGFVAWHTLSNFFYLTTPMHGKAAARAFLLDLLEFTNVAPASTAAARQAAQLPMPDFEDALQASAALACGADYIATRNRRDFLRSPVPALSPTVLLSRLG